VPDREPSADTLVGWRRRLYQVALPVGIAGGILQVLDLTGDHLGDGSRSPSRNLERGLLAAVAVTIRA
jgi:hypothetical protein